MRTAVGDGPGDVERPAFVALGPLGEQRGRERRRPLAQVAEQVAAGLHGVAHVVSVPPSERVEPCTGRGRGSGGGWATERLTWSQACSAAWTYAGPRTAGAARAAANASRSAAVCEIRQSTVAPPAAGSGFLKSNHITSFSRGNGAAAPPSSPISCCSHAALMPASPSSAAPPSAGL